MGGGDEGERRRRGGGEGGAAGGGGVISARAAALSELRSLKQKGGRRIDGFQLKLEDKIYDTLSESDYNLLVAKRRETGANAFVVADDGLGYADVGEEVEWDVDEFPHDSDGDDDEDGHSGKRRNKKNGDGDVVKKDAPNRKAAALSAAAALIGKQRLASMFTSASGMPLLGRRVRDEKTTALRKNADNPESVLDDVLANLSTHDIDHDREKRRRFAGMHSSRTAPAVVEQGPVLARQEGPGSNDYGRIAQENHDASPLHTNEDFPEVHVPEVMPMVEGKTDAPSIQETVQKEVEPKAMMAQEKFSDGSDAPAVATSRKEEALTGLNAKITPVVDTGKGATAAWQTISKGVTKQRTDKKSMKGEEGVKKAAVTSDANYLPSDASGRLSFFLIDAHEEAFGASPGSLYLFGKVLVGDKYESCCVVVHNMQHCVFAVPAPSVFPSDVLSELEQAANAGGPVETSALNAKLQELATGLKQELAEKLMDMDVVKFSMHPVKRSYAFDSSEVATGEHYFVKLSYPFKDPPLPLDLKGKNFVKLFGTRTSAMELLLIKRKMKGPCWLSIDNPRRCTGSSQVSWCKLEVSVEDPKNIMVAPPGKGPGEIPPLVVAAINLKTVMNHKHNVNEVASVSVVYCKQVKVDMPMPLAEWNKPEMLSHFSIVRKLDGGIFPMGFMSEVTQLNSKAGCTVLSSESSERALLNHLMIKLHQVDPDVLVGHNISGFDLDVLLHRLQACKVANDMWSKVGRLKRSQMPRLTGGGATFGAGAGPGAMACIAGRLLCDTYVSSRELLREVSYTLTALSKSQLGRDRKELVPSEILGMYQASTTLLELIESGETDAWLALGLMFHLSVLPLTRQLTNISGNLWSRTLQGARAQRVEYLLLHEFHIRKFIVPDKISQREKENQANKRKNAIRPDEGMEGEEDEPFEAAPSDASGKQRKRGPAYLGGLVLEPKKGLYDRFVLLLDFNSLYPSIIQEYNVCFTTVDRPNDGSIPTLPSSETPGVLPQVLKGLVERRKQVKGWLKRTSDILKYQQLDIQQQALKLTANRQGSAANVVVPSIFPVVHYGHSDGVQGREILQSTVDLVQNTLNLEKLKVWQFDHDGQVIYGDTDSIMIHTGLDDLAAAKNIAVKVIKEVNKKYRLLEIDMDGVYKRMLLLKKKKYAAVKVLSNSDGTMREVIEQKGLDIVRRDWSSLSKDIGNYCLDQILSGRSREDVVEAIHSQLRKLQEEMRGGQIELEKYIITKTLTKPPEDYPDAKNQPHVKVALRRKQSGHRIGCCVGDTVPYIICIEQGSEATPSVGIADRARHPDELKEDSGNWLIDIDYYISQQIHPVVSRLCAPIEGTDAAHIADCLGLDATSFHQRQGTTNTSERDEALLSSAAILDDDDQYRHCEPLELVCLDCCKRYAFEGVSKLLTAPTTASDSEHNDPLKCPACREAGGLKRSSPAMFANQVKLHAEEFVARYYDAWMMCDDEMCGHITRNVTLQVLGDSERGSVCPQYPGCNGHLRRQHTEVDLYKQLTHFFRLLDISRALDSVTDPIVKLAAEQKLASVRGAVDAAAQTINQLRNRCAFKWVQLDRLCITVN